jgi:Beta-lactamase
VLNHQAGLANAGLQEISRDPFVVCDNDLILSIMAQSTPEHAPGAQTNYHYLTFGWLVEGLVQSVTGGTLRDFVNTNIAVEQNIQSEFMIGIGSGNTADQQHADRLPAVSSNEREVANRVANLVLGRIVMPPRPAVAASDVATATATAAASASSAAAASATATPTAAAATATATTSNTVASTTAAAPHAPVETEVETKAEVVVKVDHSLNQKAVTVQGSKIHVRL